MDRTGWQQLAEEWINDAKTLLAAGRWGCAYYTAGYAVECALKSCVLAYVERSGIIFDDPKFLSGCRTHNLTDLMTLADLDGIYGPARGANPKLDKHWETASAWTEESRYQRKDQAEAEKLYEAITTVPDGVVQWLRAHW